MAASGVSFDSASTRFSYSLTWRAWRLGGEKSLHFGFLPRTLPNVITLMEYPATAATVETLRNGLTMILDPDPAAPVVSA